MRVLLAGASGFLGTNLVRRLTRAGQETVRLVRRDPHDVDQVRWNPGARDVDPAVVAAADVVINLAGANVGGRRWTAAYRRTLRDSRVDTTATLSAAIAGLPPEDRPRLLLNSSAVGFYGDAGADPVDESSPAGTGFFADMCRAWEDATLPASDAGVRVVTLRTGLPLSPHGGLLKPLLLPFRFGFGARLSTGRQYMPWVSLADWLAAVEFLLDHDEVAGPVNVTGPRPATNADFTSALGRVLHRPALLRVPRFALAVVAGAAFAGEMLASQRVVPAKLTGSGFRFTHWTVDAALADALRR